jgi:hypothetical protein
MDTKTIFDNHRHSVACRRRRLVRQGTPVLTGSDGTYSACQHCGKRTRIKELAGGSLNQADPSGNEEAVRDLCRTAMSSAHSGFPETMIVDRKPNCEPFNF